MPTIQKVVLTITTHNIKKLTSLSLFLELITYSKCYTLLSKKPNMSLKIQAGTPIGCKVTLRKKKMFNFLSVLLLLIKPKDTSSFNILNKNLYNFLNFTLNNVFIFNIAEKNYTFFKDILIKLSFVTNLLIVKNSF